MTFRIAVVKSKTKTGIVSSLDYSSCLLPALAVAGILAFTASVSSKQAVVPTPQTVKLSSAVFVTADGLSVERLIELGTNRRADLLAARQRLAIAEGRLTQAGLRPNPTTLNTEYGSARFLGGEPENDFSAGVSQTLELGGGGEAI